MTFKKGDLVMVVRPRTCCGFSGGLGLVFTIEGDNLDRYVSCSSCRTVRSMKGLVALSRGMVCEPSRLIKIDPPADDTEEVADKELEGVV